MRCKKCDSEIAELANFCPNCGSKVERDLKEEVTELRKEVIQLKSIIDGMSKPSGGTWKGAYSANNTESKSYHKKYHRRPTDEKIELRNKLIEALKAGCRSNQEVCKYAGLSYKKLQKKISGFVLPLRAELGINPSEWKYKDNRGHKRAPVKQDGRVSRMKFMQSRANNLMNQQNISRERAFAIASGEWNKNKRTIVFPDVFDGVQLNSMDSKSATKLLQDMLENVVKMNGSLSYQPDGIVLTIDAPSWKTFTANFLNHSYEIAKYYGVPNKFKLVEMEGREPSKIKYF